MNGRAHIDCFEMNSDTVVIAVMPLFHTLGLSGILNAALTTGGTVVLIKRFDAVNVFEASRRSRRTVTPASLDLLMLSSP